jgi:YHS domain-containing protein
MVVGDDGPHTEGPDGITYYFCGEACRSTFLANRAPQAGQRRSGEVIP